MLFFLSVILIIICGVQGKTEQSIGYKFYVQICRAAATYPLISINAVDDCDQNEYLTWLDRAKNSPGNLKI